MAIVLLVSAFALFTFFSNLRSPTSAFILEEGAINVRHSSCLLNEDKYTACVTIVWDAPQNFYSKVYISGGESLSDTPKFYAHEFTYCQDLDKKLGNRVANIYLHDENGRWVKFIKGYKIDCS